MFSRSFIFFTRRIFPSLNFYSNAIKSFTGKTETGYKFKTPDLKMRNIKPIPPPGLNLEIPKDWTPDRFCTQIGGDCFEYADKFKSVEEIFSVTTEEMREKGIPIKQRKYILRIKELMRRGLITFEFLARRTCVKPVHKLTKSSPNKKAKKTDAKGKGAAAGKKESKKG